MQRVIIVDNEKPALDLLERILKTITDVEIVGKFQKPSQVLANVELLKPDVAFLDIEMPGINGIELAMRIYEINPDIDFVFVTAFDQYAVEAFEINAIDYLLKPVVEEKLQRSIDRLLKKRDVNKIARGKDTSSVVSIRMLGAFETSTEGSQQVKWITSKVEELFAILLLHNYNISKWALMEMLWPNSQPHKAEQNLYTSVFRLKQTLKDEELGISIDANKGTYKMICDNIHWDVGALMDAKDCKDLGKMEKALEAYHGELLEGKDYLWSYELRQNFCNTYQDIAINVAKAYMSVDKLAKSIDVLEQTLKFCPSNPKSMRLLQTIATKNNMPADLAERIRSIQAKQSDQE
jgi:two-component SAPR family response regulator